MVLEALAALSLAGTIVQFFEFTRKLISTSKEVYTSADGAANEVLQHEAIYSSLRDLSDRLAASRAHALTTGRTIPREERDLQNLAGSCVVECDKLLNIIDALRTKPEDGKLRTFYQALKTVWKQSKIDAFVSTLNRYQLQLNSILIFLLKYGLLFLAPGIVGMLMVHSEKQSTVLRELQEIREENRQMDLTHTKKLDEVTNVFREMSKTLINHKFQSDEASGPRLLTDEVLGRFSVGISHIVGRVSIIAVCQKLLQTLHFPTINVRHSRIDIAHKKTFKWVFKPEKNPQAPGVERLPNAGALLHWLESENGIFWISGKAGSGKSTLMKYLSDHEQTDQALEKWAGDKKQVKASFYFWAAGTAMQKSQQGLLQSLLYEIFNHAPQLAQELCPGRWEEARRRRRGDFQNDSSVNDPDWTIQELHATLQNLTTQTRIPVKFCFFIDGLDEYSGDHLEILQLLDSLSHSPHIKLCVSSRPWNVFEDAYGQNVDRKLYVHDLTRRDISKYVQTKLQEHPAWAGLTVDDVRYDAILTDIRNRAQGVFLWVFLVVRSLLEGLTAGDTLSLLQERLRQIPTDLKKFFRYMLDSLDPVYNRHVALTFQVAVHASTPLALAAYSFLDDEFENTDYVFDLDNTEASTLDIILRHKDTKRRLNGRCKGLLESYRDDSGTDFLRYRVEFLHRTVRDYFRTDEMQEHFNSKLPKGLDINVSMLKAATAMLKKTPKIGENIKTFSTFKKLLSDAWFYARQAELSTQKASVELLDELEFTLESFGYLGSEAGQSHWETTECFLELCIERGLCQYASKKLLALGERSISKIPFCLTSRRRYVLECALTMPELHDREPIDVLDMVEFLLQNGADPNDKQNVGNTHFWYFAQSTINDSDHRMAKIRILKSLLSYGADANVLGHDNRPILLLALQKISMVESKKKSKEYHLAILDLLLCYGADPTLKFTCKGRQTTAWTEFIIFLNKTKLSGTQLLSQAILSVLKYCKDRGTIVETDWTSRSGESHPTSQELLERLAVGRLRKDILPLLEIIKDKTEVQEEQSIMELPLKGPPQSRVNTNRKEEVPQTGSRPFSFWGLLSWSQTHHI